MTDTALSILIVDDDEFLVDMYALKFSQAGHMVQSAMSVEQALSKLHEEGYTPDAVVFDLVMPHMDGFEFLQKVRDEKLARDTVFIALSNQNEPEDVERIMSLGAAGHIVKAECVPSEVLKRVESIVTKHAAAAGGSTHA